MIAKLVYDKEGVAGLKRLMRYNSYEDLFENEFHISTPQLNAFLREQIKLQAGK
jgi:hypothetical protein